MRIRTFTGRGLEELLPKIREELGPDAVVLSQRERIVGGIGGFFGTKMLEVTVADRMPDDDALIAMDSQVASGQLTAAAVGGTGGTGTAVADPTETALADRFRGAMKMGRQGGLDVTDTWDPSQDEDLAEEYGRVLEHAAASGGFAELDVPVVDRTAAAAAAPTTRAPVPSLQGDPIEQARQLADRAHAHVAASTERMEASYAPPAAPGGFAGTYAPPSSALPSNSPGRSFQASVVDSPVVSAEPMPHVTNAQQAEAALQSDLSASRAIDQVRDAVANAIDIVDMQAISALRSATRPSANDWRAEAGPELSASLGVLAEMGVDDDVSASIAQMVLRHRAPFAGSTSASQLIRDVVEEVVDVRTGFLPRTDRAHTLALVGTSSSGKTTVAAKIAHGYAQAGMRVAMVVILPDDPTAAIVQDSRLGSLGADVRYVTNHAQAQMAAGMFVDHDLVIVDTPGTTYLDRSVYAHVHGCLEALDVDDVHVVVPLSASSRDAADLVDAFTPLGANRLIVSRIDESRYAGQILNLGFRLGLPMTYLSDGPRIPDDLRVASAREISTMILATNTNSHES